LAFNVAGGLTRPSGSYIFFFTILAVLVGLVWKAVLGEAADTNLSDSLLTMEAYLCGICGMLIAALISKRIRSKRAWLEGSVTEDKMQSAAVGCLVTGLALSVIFTFSEVSNGSILSALAQINRFLPLAVILGTIHAIRRSGGTRSYSMPVLIGALAMFVTGIFSFSKEGMFTPIVCWLLPCASQAYRFSRAQIVSGILLTFFLFHYLVPYSQYGRNLREDSFSDNLNVSLSLLTNLGSVRSEFLQTEADKDADQELARGYFTDHQGFFDRLQMIGPDDSLIELTEQQGTAGYLPVYLYFANLVPHFIWPNKPSWGGGNFYAHQMGLLAEDDTTTGISFSPVGEAFHLLGWTGLFLLAPILWIMLFTLFDSLCGDTRRSPWGLLVLLAFAHSAPEGGLGLIIYDMGYMTLGILFAASFATYIMPIFGDLSTGSGRRMVRFRALLIAPATGKDSLLEGRRI
jgi:hypothetical protein